MNNIEDENGEKMPRLKLTREESIGDYSWDTSPSTINGGTGVNEWSEADAMKLLNEYYYNSESNKQCYNNKNNASVTCDFSVIGLNTNAKEMIETVKWYTGSNGKTNFNSVVASEFYNLERSDNTGKNCSGGTNCNDNINRSSSWIGKVALVHFSDYIWAANFNKNQCLKEDIISWLESCNVDNWLNKRISQWSLNPIPHTSDARRVVCLEGYERGCLSYDGYRADGIFPTIYLKSSIRITNGIGTKDSPFELSV